MGAFPSRLLDGALGHRANARSRALRRVLAVREMPVCAALAWGAVFFLPGELMRSRGEMDSETGLQLPTARDAARRFGRALLLRCPNCGGGPIVKNWLKLHVRCGNCGIRTERGEHDYFMGSMMLNFVMTGTILLVAIAVTLVTRWPDVPWDTLQWVGPAAMIVLPFVLFPWSKLVWLAFDIMLRPVTPEELEWHRTAGSEWSTEYAPRQDG
jgi:uncharacterized protein (DUF983 family)